MNNFSSFLIIILRWTLRSKCESLAMSTLMTSRCDTRLLSTRIVPVSTSQWGCMRVPISTHMIFYLMTSYDDILSQPWNDLKLSAYILTTQITVHFIMIQSTRQTPSSDTCLMKGCAHNLKSSELRLLFISGDNKHLSESSLTLSEPIQG